MTAVAATEPEASASIACVRCGYDLTGLDDRRPCPECGLLSGLSRVDGRRLRDNHPRWLRRLSLACWTLAATPPLLVAAGFVILAMHDWYEDAVVDIYDRLASTGVFPWFLSEWSLFRANASPGQWATLAAFLAAWSVPFLACGGGVVLLMWRSGRHNADRHDRWRRRLLLLLILPLLPWAVLVPMSILSSEIVGDFIFRYFARFVSQDALIAAVLLSLLPLGAGIAVLTRHLSDLARRAPAPLLAADSPIVGYTLAACTVPPALLAIVQPDGFMRSNVGLVVICLYLTTLITATLWSCYLLVRYALAFAQSRRQAQAAFAAADKAAPGVE